VRLLVTGGAGFIGSNFVQKCFSGDFSDITSVTVLDKLTYAGNLKNLESVSQRSGFNFEAGDICDEVKVLALIKDCDAVINFAAESHVDRSIQSSEAFVNTNICGVRTLLDSIRYLGQSKRLVQVSTDEVYGSIQVDSWTEESQLLPNSPYSASKAGAELLIRSYVKTHGLDVVITRSCNNFGPYQHPEKLIPLFITNLMRGEYLPIYGDGSNVRDWIHVDDHCEAIYRVLFSGKTGHAYNIGGGNEISNLQIAELILEFMRKQKLQIKFVEDRKGHDFRYSVNWSKIKDELSFEPKISLKMGLQSTIDWYQNNMIWLDSFGKDKK
jgi:dTDP-glucose 4,6-dehydratase